jgi:hypothetical protein
MENKKTRKAREKERKKKAKQRASQSPEKKLKLWEEKAKQRASQSLEKKQKLREENTRKRKVARDNLSPEKQTQLRARGGYYLCMLHQCREELNI